MADKTDIEIVYFAGFFDGEGMVSIYEKSSSYVVVLANTDIRPLKRARDLWGGKLSCQVKAGTRFAQQDMWRWTICSHEARGFLEDIRPYVMLKGEQIDVFLEVLDQIPTKPGRKRGPGATEALQEADRRLRLLKRGAA